MHKSIVVLINMKLTNLAKKYNMTCFYCGKKFKLHELTREHLVPKSQGGGCGKNLRLACKLCNSKVGNMRIGQKLMFKFNKNYE